MKPNILLNLLWLIPTYFCHYLIYKTTGFIFAAKIQDDKPISYYFDKPEKLPFEFRS